MQTNDHENRTDCSQWNKDKKKGQNNPRRNPASTLSHRKQRERDEGPATKGQHVNRGIFAEAVGTFLDEDVGEQRPDC